MQIVADQKVTSRKAEKRYRPRPIPQALGSLGGQEGIGSMPTLATETCFLAEADEVWVVAAAPVMTRTATNARTIIFIIWAFSISK